MSAKELKKAFASAKARHAIVDIDGIGKVMVRELLLRDWDEVDYDSTTEARARNVALAIFTPDGSERIFDPDDAEDIAIIKGLGGSVINQIMEALAEKN